MGQSGFDDLVNALSNNFSSRRRFPQIVGATVVGAPLLILFPNSAGAGTKKGCRKKHGKYLASGERHCAPVWRKGQANYYQLRCPDTVGCACFQTTAGSGVCARYNVPDNHEGCVSDAECDTGAVCTVLYAESCENKLTCSNPQFRCINGTCQYSSCREACS